MQPADWPAVSRIYREGIDTGMATFETEVPGWKAWNQSHLHHSRLVAVMDDEVVGWAALSSIFDRCVYCGVAEISIYVATDRRGKGIGTQLLEALVNQSEMVYGRCKRTFWLRIEQYSPSSKMRISYRRPKRKAWLLVRRIKRCNVTGARSDKAGIQ